MLEIAPEPPRAAPSDTSGPSAESSGLSLTELEDQLCATAASLAAQTCRWLELLAEFERREGWAGWGVRSCAHWLAYRCSMSPGAAREHMRVARSLAGLPLLRAAFGRGQLSYSKARALTRIATATNEAELVELARTATAAQLERIVRAYQKANQTALRSYERRRHRWHWEEDGTLIVRARLLPEEGATYLAALRSAQAAATNPADNTPPEKASAAVRPDPHGTAEADALVMMAAGFLTSAGTADCSGDDRTLVVVHVDADTLDNADAGEAGPRPGPAVPPPVRPRVAGAPDAHPRCRLAGGPGIAPTTAARLACDSAVVAMLRDREGHVLDVGRRTRRINTALRRALRARDHGCRYPSCTRVRFLDAHHIRPWSSGGPTDLDNLILLCWRHHTLVHEGLVTVSVTATGGLHWTRPDGRPVPAVYLHPGTPARPPGKPFDLDSLRPRWAGEELDLGWAVAGLLQPCRPDRAPTAKNQPKPQAKGRPRAA